MSKYLSEKKEIIKSEPWIWYIIPIQKLRETNNVEFDAFPLFPEINGIDIVTHEKWAYSPTLPSWDNDVWYMHPWQEDNLITLCWNRVVELYNKNTKKIETFELSHKKIKLNWNILYEGPAILWWNIWIFHRNHSPKGSVSQNFAVRNKKFNLDTEFNIYKLDVKTWEYEVARIWKKDQPK
jgi:hypothetical protein